MLKNLKTAILLTLSLTVLQFSYAQLGVGTVTPDASAMFEINSTEKGMLISRMTTAQRNAIASPATSLMIFNTSTAQYEYYDGTSWTPIDSGGDDLGNHTATTDITLGSNFLSGDGDSEGISINTAGDATFSSDATITDNVTVGNVLNVTDSASTAFFAMTNGATNGYVLQSDASGNASWVDAATLTVTGDDLGNHTATTDITLGSNFLSGDGDSEGISINAAGDATFSSDATITDNVTVGNVLNVTDSASTAFFAMTNGATNGYVLQSDASGNASWVDAATLTVTGDDLGNHTATTDITLGSNFLSGDGDSEGISINAAGDATFSSDATITDNVTVGNVLNVTDSASTAFFAMTNGATNGYVLQSDASGNASWVDAATLTVTGDDLGNHTATTDITLGSNFLSGDGDSEGISINAAGDATFSSDATITDNVTVGNVLNVTDSASTAFFAMTNGATNGYVLQSDASGNASWVDAATLTVTGDDLGNHTATTDITLGSNFLSGDGDSEGISINAAGDATFSSDATITDNVTVGNVLNVTDSASTAFFAMTNGATNGYVLQSDASGNASWVDAATLTVTGDDLGNHTATTDITLGSNFLSGDGDSEGISINAAGDATFSSDATITDNVTVGNVLNVTDSASTAFFAMTNGATNGYVLQSDASGNASWVDAATLTVTGDDLGNHTATTDVNLSGNWLSGDGDSEGIFIEADGDVGIGTSTPQAKFHVSGVVVATAAPVPSDFRFKEKIQPLQNATELVMQLDPVSYLYKNKAFPTEGFPKKQQIGFIAQDMEKVLPYLVYTRKDGYKMVDYAKITPVLTEAVQELNQRLEEVEQENSRLRQQVKEQQNLADRVAQLEAQLQRIESQLNK